MSNLINKIGIMNGRLSEPLGTKIQEFPYMTWKDEFTKASDYGFESIEWIFDSYAQNPIMNIDGITKIKQYSEQSGIAINSVLADFFMEKKLTNVSQSELEKNIDILKKLIKNCNTLGVEILEIPFVDSSSLQNKSDQQNVRTNLEGILKFLDEYNVSLSLETDLHPKQFRDFLLSFQHPKIKANYDVGNSAGLGYNMKEEFENFGNLITNIHIKDREYSGNTVPLGTGNVDFPLFFKLLKQNNYSGDFIIQGARESGIDSGETAKKYLKFVKELVDKYLSNDSDNL